MSTPNHKIQLFINKPSGWLPSSFILSTNRSIYACTTGSFCRMALALKAGRIFFATALRLAGSLSQMKPRSPAAKSIRSVLTKSSWFLTDGP